MLSLLVKVMVVIVLGGLSGERIYCPAYDVRVRSYDFAGSQLGFRSGNDLLDIILHFVYVQVHFKRES